VLGSFLEIRMGERPLLPFRAGDGGGSIKLVLEADWRDLFFYIFLSFSGDGLEEILAKIGG
jgi:hypothetical protein